MGTVNVNALETTAGNIFFIASEAAVDLSRPPFKQSSNVNNDCRTGLEYETCNRMSNPKFILTVRISETIPNDNNHLSFKSPFHYLQKLCGGLPIPVDI